MTVAAFTGLRLGELRALRWADADFAKRLAHVRHSLSRTEMRRPKSQTVRRGLLRTDERHIAAICAALTG